MSGHTPGPWTLGAGRRHFANLSVFAPIGETTFRWRVALACRDDGEGMPQAEAEANARLIAAAPDLLDAVHRCLNLLEIVAGPDEAAFIEKATAKVRAAIAKAEGSA